MTGLNQRATRHLILAAAGIAAVSSMACSGLEETQRAAVTSLVAASPTSMTATVGMLVPELPAVQALDAQRRPVVGAEVSFAYAPVAASFTRTVVRTGEDGIARLRTLLVPIIAGRSTVTATVAGAAPVSFDLTTVAGPIEAIFKESGDEQTAYVSATTSMAPTVRLVDSYGNGVAGTVVAFRVDDGDGILSVTSPTSDAHGVASAGAWFLRSLGRHAVTATVDGFLPLVFTARAVESPRRCGGDRQISFNATLSAALAASDCLDAAGRPFQSVSALLPAGEYTFRLNSADFDGRLQIVDEFGALIAENDNADSTTKNSVIRGLFGGQPLVVVVGAAQLGGSGTFSLAVEQGWPFADCYDAFATKGVSVERTVSGSPCVGTPAGPGDRYRIYLNAGEELTVSVRDYSYSSWFVEAYDLSGQSVARSRYTGNYTETLSFIARAAGFYHFDVRCDDSNGQYALNIR